MNSYIPPTTHRTIFNSKHILCENSSQIILNENTTYSVAMKRRKYPTHYKYCVVYSITCTGPTLPKKRLSSICNNSNAAECISTRGQPVISNVTIKAKRVYLHEKFLIILRIKLQKCALTSRILILSLSVSDIKYCIAPSIYSTNVGCNDIVSRSKTQVLQIRK
uniref:Uncharacterized protein n=1 Tax=Glossina palpalis gambiensis TaxID=67801 RepID=A0A1B0BX43_9MUSC